MPTAEKKPSSSGMHQRGRPGAGWAPSPTPALPCLRKESGVTPRTESHPVPALEPGHPSQLSPRKAPAPSSPPAPSQPAAGSLGSVLLQAGPRHRAGHSAGHTEQGTKATFPPGSRGRVEEVEAQGRFLGCNKPQLGSDQLAQDSLPPMQLMGLTASLRGWPRLPNVLCSVPSSPSAAVAWPMK